jgi:hypothetical protein
LSKKNNLKIKLKKMKKIIAVLLFTSLASCGVTIKSVVDNNSRIETFKNSLIVIPFEKGVTKNFVENFKEEIEQLFKQDNKKIEIILFEKSNKTLQLNENSDIDQQINFSINQDDKDLLIIFKPSNLAFYNGALQSLTYEIVAIETKSKKEVWKAEFNSNSSFGPALFAKKSAKTIYDKLLTDKIL